MTTTPINRPYAEVTVAGDTALARGGWASLDAMNVPYATSRLTLPLVSPEEVEDIDPRDGIRAVIVAGDDHIGSSRLFDLAVRSRRADHKGKTIEMELASDEALLMDYAPLSTDTGARAHETSLRAVVNYVLGKIGASLEAGTYDADVTAAWSLSNLLGNPSFETNTAGWSSGGNTSTFSRSTSLATPYGVAYCAVTASAAGNSYIQRDETIRVDAGRMYTLSAYMRPQAANRQGRVIIRWISPLGTLIRESVGTRNNMSTAAFERVSVSAIAPKNAAAMRVIVGMAAGAAGEINRIDAIMFNEGPLTTYIDGGLPADPYYTYAWDDGADSTSTRTPFVERDPDLYTWDAGTNAWDFLDPFTASTGLRLFCDEQRKWRLIDPAEYYVPGVLTLSPYGSTEGTDLIGLGDPEVYCTGVVVIYSWVDRDGIQRTRRDTAGTPGLVLVVQIDRPWPGAGVAAWMLARRNGQGRQQEVTALAKWSATPAMQVNISLPGTLDQLGQLEAVEWGLTDGLMNVKTRALTDLIPGSIDALVGTIDALVGTIDSL